LRIKALGLPHYLGPLRLKDLRGPTGLGHFGPLKPYSDYKYIAFVIIALNHHAQLNRSIYYILVYISTCAFPILLDYNLELYYQALHYLLTRGCDHLIGRCRDKLIFLTFFIILLIIPGFSLSGSRLIPFSYFIISDFRYENLCMRNHFFLAYISNTFRFPKILYTLYNKGELLKRFACSFNETLL
jgi:hypothetical protein